MNAVTLILDSLAEEARADHSDSQLLDLFVRLRDEEAFAAVVRRHGPMVLGVCRRVLRNAADADDAFQAAFLVLARKAGTIGTRHLLAQWLYGVAYNTARKLRQSNTRRAVRELPLAEGVEPHATPTDPRDELFAILDEELTQLPDRYRAVIVLCDLEGLTRREAARLLNCPEGTVGGRLSRARALLAERLTRRGIVSAAGLLVAVLTERSATAVPPAALAAVVRSVGVDDLAGAASQGLISPRVAHTTEGVLKSMFATKLRTIAAAVLCCGLAVACGVGAIHFANAQPKTDPKPKETLDPFDGGRGDPGPKWVGKPAESGKLLNVIPLKKLDAKETADKLLKLLPKEVTVAAVRDENALLVYATAKGTDDVRLVLRTLGEELPKDAPKPADPKPKVSAVKKYTFGFRNTPWADVLDWYSKESGLTMITTVKPTGTVTLWPPQDKQYTLAEITDLINEALAQQKFVLIPRHMTFFIHPADEKIDGVLPARVSLEDLPNRGRSEIVQVTLPIKGMVAADAQDEVKKLLTPFGSIVAFKNFLLIQDTAGNIIRIQKLLEEAEKPTDPFDPLKPVDRPTSFVLRFEQKPWKDMFEWYAGKYELTRVGNALPTGTFTVNVMQDKPFTRDEIADHMNDVLLKQNWLLVRHEKTFAVIPADEKVDSKYVHHVTLDELRNYGRTKLVEVTIPLPIDVGEVKGDVKRLLTPFGTIVSAEGKQLVVRDVIGTVRRIQEILESWNKRAKEK